MLRPDVELRPLVRQELAVQGVFQPKQKSVIAGFADFAPATFSIAFGQGQGCLFLVWLWLGNDRTYGAFRHRSFSINFRTNRMQNFLTFAWCFKYPVFRQPHVLSHEPRIQPPDGYPLFSLLFALLLSRLTLQIRPHD